MDTLQLRCGKAGSVIGIGEFRTDVQMNNRVSRIGVGREKVQKLLYPRCGGLRQDTVFAETGIHVQRSKGLPVKEGFFSQRDGQRNYLYIVPLQQLLRKITGAVGGNNNRICHSLIPFIFLKSRRS